MKNLFMNQKKGGDSNTKLPPKRRRQEKPIRKDGEGVKQKQAG